MGCEHLDLRTIKGRKVVIKDTDGCGIGGAWIEGVGDVNASSMNIPVRGRVLLDKGITGIEEIDPDFGYENFSFGYPAAAVVLSKESSIALREQNKKDWDAKMAAVREKMKAEEAELAKNVPGIEELKAAYAAKAEYRRAFNAAMEDEYNDGVHMPVLPTANIEELEAKYPIAALYLKADSYTYSENYAKSAAGDKAKAILADGGDHIEAARILDNWLNDVYVD